LKDISLSSCSKDQRFLRRIRQCSPAIELGADVEKQVEIQVKYEGYIRRQVETAEKLKKLEEKVIPEILDYKKLPGISKEILCKLEEVRPANLGQASRIQGMTPAALSIIIIELEKIRRSKANYHHFTPTVNLNSCKKSKPRHARISFLRNAPSTKSVVLSVHFL
jgi:tRNA U34 5-carboxymethylaminomethyl modifying enzyme MnmG/GidA